LPPAAIGAVVGSLLGAIILWILFVIWLKKRKKSKKGFKGIEDPRVVFSPTEDIVVNPFTSLVISPPSNPVDLKSRPMQEVSRPVSPQTSIGVTGTGSQISVVPGMETQSQEPRSVASSSDPFKRPLFKDPGRSMI
jgi:hypothetical protein